MRILSLGEGVSSRLATARDRGCFPGGRGGGGVYLHSASAYGLLTDPHYVTSLSLCVWSELLATFFVAAEEFDRKSDANKDKKAPRRVFTSLHNVSQHL